MTSLSLDDILTIINSLPGHGRLSSGKESRVEKRSKKPREQNVKNTHIANLFYKNLEATSSPEMDQFNPMATYRRQIQRQTDRE
jgi:hypothetical protein